MTSAQNWPKQQYSHDMTPLSGIIPAPVVQKVDNAIRWINLYSVDSVIGFPNTYQLDSDLSNG